MRKPIKLFASISVAAALLSANPAAAGGGGVSAYNRTYYSDASLSNQVGISYFNYCRIGPQGDEVVYYRSGTQTVHYTRELVGYCMDGEYFDA